MVILGLEKICSSSLFRHGAITHGYNLNERKGFLVWCWLAVSTSKTGRGLNSLKIGDVHAIVRGQLKKNTRKCCADSRACSSKHTIAPYGTNVHVTRHWNLMNSYWMFWIGRLRGARSVSSFCDFRRTTFCDLTAISAFWREKSCVFQMLLIKEYPNLFVSKYYGRFW